MLESRKELKERIEAQEARIAELEQEVLQASAEKEESAELVQAAAADLQEAQGRVSELEEQITESEALRTTAENAISELKVEIQGLNEESEKAPLRVAEEAAAQLASAGHEPVAVTESGGMTEEDFHRHYNSITDGRERSAWYLANKHLIGR